MSKRVMGKASFAGLRDAKGDIQAYVRRDDIGEESYSDFKAYDIGDMLGITGFVFKTKTGEISIHAETVAFAPKSKGLFRKNSMVFVILICVIACAMLTLS